MPSWVALGTTALASVHERVLILPVLVVVGAVESFGGVAPSLVPTLLRLALWPFALAATVFKHLGVALQALVLLQAVLFDSLGDGLNSFVSSGNSTSQTLSAARNEVAVLRANYDTQLAAFFGTHFDPLVPLPDVPLTRDDLDEWERAGVVLRRDLERGIAEAVELWSTVLDDDDDNRRGIEYLVAVRDELDRIQRKRPTAYLYRTRPPVDQAFVQDVSDSDLADADAEAERADREYEARQASKLDAKFNAFLDQMGMDDNARATLDHASNPKDPNSATFRQLLRSSWQGMYGAGGVMGNVENELGALFGGGYSGSEGDGDDDEVFDLGMGAPIEPGENLDDKLASPEYKPGRIPLMTIHLLRDQLERAILDRTDSASATSKGLARYLEPEDPTDVQILPKLSRQVSDDYLGFFQRAVKVDIRARQVALAVLKRVSPSSSSSDESPSSHEETHETTKTKTKTTIRPSILLSPRPGFPEFVKKLDWTLSRSSERFLSKHEFAQAAFGTDKGYLALRRKEREVEKLERSERLAHNGKSEPRPIKGEL